MIFNTVKIDIINTPYKRVKNIIMEKFPYYKKIEKLKLHRCITTNGIVNNEYGKNSLVMGKGIAKDARRKYPEIPVILGDLVSHYGNRTFFLPHNLVSFPTKHDWGDKSQLQLIGESFLQLLKDAYTMNSSLSINDTWHTFLLPRPGCNNGGLDWKTLVRPYLERLWEYFSEERVHKFLAQQSIFHHLGNGAQFVIFVRKDIIC